MHHKLQYVNIVVYYVQHLMFFFPLSFCSCGFYHAQLYYSQSFLVQPGMWQKCVADGIHTITNPTLKKTQSDVYSCD